MEFAPQLPTKNRRKCCVHGCFSAANRNREVTFHRIPKLTNSLVRIKNKLGYDDITLNRREAWMKALKIKKIRNDEKFVCSLHFTENDYKSAKDKNLSKRFLKSYAVPTCNLPTTFVRGQTISNFKMQCNIANSSDKQMLENDVDNWFRYKMIGGKIHMKPEVVPHIFFSQPTESKRSKLSANIEVEHQTPSSVYHNPKMKRKSPTPTLPNIDIEIQDIKVEDIKEEEAECSTSSAQDVKIDEATEEINESPILKSFFIKTEPTLDHDTTIDQVEVDMPSVATTFPVSLIKKELDPQDINIFDVLWNAPELIKFPALSWGCHRHIFNTKQRCFILTKLNLPSVSQDLSSSDGMATNNAVIERQIVLPEELWIQFHIDGVPTVAYPWKWNDHQVRTVEELNEIIADFANLQLCKGGPKVKVYPEQKITTSTAKIDKYTERWRHNQCLRLNYKQILSCDQCQSLFATFDYQLSWIFK